MSEILWVANADINEVFVALASTGDEARIVTPWGTFIVREDSTDPPVPVTVDAVGAYAMRDTTMVFYEGEERLEEGQVLRSKRSREAVKVARLLWRSSRGQVRVEVERGVAPWGPVAAAVADGDVFKVMAP